MPCLTHLSVSSHSSTLILTDHNQDIGLGDSLNSFSSPIHKERRHCYAITPNATRKISVSTEALLRRWREQKEIILSSDYKIVVLMFVVDEIVWIVFVA